MGRAALLGVVLCGGGGGRAERTTLAPQKRRRRRRRPPGAVARGARVSVSVKSLCVSVCERERKRVARDRAGVAQVEHDALLEHALPIWSVRTSPWS